MQAVQLLFGQMSEELDQTESAELQSELIAARAAKNPEERAAAAWRILDIVEGHPRLRGLLRAELLRQRERMADPGPPHLLVDAVLEEIRQSEEDRPDSSQRRHDWLAQVLGDAFVLDPLDGGSDERTVTLRPGGLGGGTSRKLANFRIVPDRLVNVVMGAVMTAVTGPNPLTVAFAVWSVVHLLYGSVRRELGEDQATVLWGLLVALAAGSTTDAATVIKVVNKERRRSGLEPLPPIRVRGLLHELADNRVIRQNGERIELKEHIVVRCDRAPGWTTADRILE
ncbi:MULTISPECIES: hypothetical protein [Microbispora]|uniref:Uncharacterized protein n=1 Tax=Microbispora hainanensis TaxID=568844 RepID=A0ABZ1SU60_9ACTN|nr:MULTISPECIES: hypothetical protein [Microbispora]